MISSATKTSVLSRSARWISMLLLGMACIFFLMVAMIAWKGGRFRLGVLSAGDPTSRLAGGCISLAAWYLLRLRISGQTIRWKQVMSRFAFLFGSLAISLLFAEWAFRRTMQSTQGFGTLSMLSRSLSISPRDSGNSALLYNMTSISRRISSARLSALCTALKSSLVTARSGFSQWALSVSAKASMHCNTVRRYCVKWGYSLDSSSPKM